MSQPRCKVKTSCPVRSEPAKLGHLSWAFLMSCGKTVLVELPTGQKAPRVYDCCGNAPGEVTAEMKRGIGGEDSVQVENLSDSPSEAPKPKSEPPPPPKAKEPPPPEEDRPWVSVMDMLDSLPED